MAGASEIRRHWAIVWLLLAATLFVRAFVPQGWMPDRSGGGAFVVEMCNSDALLTIPVPAHPDKPDQHDRDAGPCAFAGMTGPVVLPPDGPAIIAPLALSDAHFQSRVRALKLAQARSRPHSTGPPMSA